MVIQRAHDRRPRRRRRRWPRAVALALLVLLAGVGLALWRLTADRERLSRLLVERARTSYGLELRLRAPAAVELWPRPSIRLEGVRASVAGSARLVAEIETVSATVPWRALWARELALGGVVVVHPRVHREALVEWLAALAPADAGPPEPLRWPSSDRPLKIEQLAWVDAAGAAVTPATLDLTLTPIAVGTPLAIDAVWRSPAKPITLAIRGVPRDSGAGLLLDQLSATLSANATAGTSVRASGSASFASPAAWSLHARLDALRWPQWLVAAPDGIDAAQRIALEARIDARGDTLGLLARGTLGGSALDARLSVPESVLAAPNGAGIVQTLLRELRGTASIDRLEIGGMVLEGIRIEGDDELAPAP
jgi:hypothetical protein